MLLDLPRSELVSLDDLAIADEAPEEGETFEANAEFKARFYAERSGLPTVADDSGSEVDALGGLPGVRSRRYSGDDATDELNNEKLLRELEGLAPERRTARYRCVLAFVEGGTGGEGGGDAAALVAHGTLEGRIAAGPRGTGGFGYDPVFEPLTESAGGRTVGMLSPDEKNRISHRAMAAARMGELLRARGY